MQKMCILNKGSAAQCKRAPMFKYVCISIAFVFNPLANSVKHIY